MADKIETSKPIIGICGGIGAGKSAVAASLEEAGCLVIDADKLGHEALNSAEAIEQIVDWWGDDVLNKEGRPDRSKIGKIVFSDPAEKKRLESLIHPLIAARRMSMIAFVESQPAIKAIVFDSPLLFESKLDRHCDAVIFVHAPEAQRFQRVSENRGWGKEEFQRRERQQLSTAEKRSRSQYIVENTGTRDELRNAVQDTLRRILAATPTHRP